MRFTTNSRCLGRSILRVLVLLEGESDCALLDSHLDHQVCKTIPAYSKTAALGAIEKVNADTLLSNVLAVVDADLDGLAAPIEHMENLIRTTLYDLDAEVFFLNEVTIRTIRNLCPCAAIRAQLETDEQRSELMSEITAAVHAVGAVRLMSTLKSLQIRTMGFPFDQLTMPSSGRPEDLLISVIETVTQLDPKARSKVASEAQAQAMAVSRERLCKGHDLSSFLAHKLRVLSGRQISAQAIERALRAAVGCDTFERLSVHGAVLQWTQARSTPPPWACPC